MKVSELREIAKNKKIKNWWKLTKAELISAIDGVNPEVGEVVQFIKENNIENISTEKIEEIAESNEIILREHDVENIKKELKVKGMKIIYAEKDSKVCIIKDHGAIWPLWYKYRDLGYTNIMAFEYEKCFGDVINTNKRTIKKSEFIKNNANPDVFVTFEEFDKGGKNEKI